MVHHVVLVVNVPSFPSSGPERPPVAAAGHSTIEFVCWSLWPRSPAGPRWCYLQGHDGARGRSGTWADDSCQGSVQGTFYYDKDRIITAFCPFWKHDISFLSRSWLTLGLFSFYMCWRHILQIELKWLTFLSYLQAGDVPVEFEEFHLSEVQNMASEEKLEQVLTSMKNNKVAMKGSFTLLS